MRDASDGFKHILVVTAAPAGPADIARAQGVSSLVIASAHFAFSQPARLSMRGIAYTRLENANAADRVVIRITGESFVVERMCVFFGSFKKF